MRTHVRYYLGQHSLGEVGLRHVGVWGEDVVDIAPVLGPHVACILEYNINSSVYFTVCLLVDCVCFFDACLFALINAVGHITADR